MPRSERSPVRSTAMWVTHEATAFGPLLCTGALITSIIYNQYLFAVFCGILAIDWCNYIRPERMIGVYAILAVGIALHDEYVYALGAILLVGVQLYRKYEVVDLT